MKTFCCSLLTKSCEQFRASPVLAVQKVSATSRSGSFHRAMLVKTSKCEWKLAVQRCAEERCTHSPRRGVTSLWETRNFQFTLRGGGVATGTSAPLPGHSDSVEVLNLPFASNANTSGLGISRGRTAQYNNIAFCLILEDTQQFFKGPIWCKIFFTNNNNNNSNLCLFSVSEHHRSEKSPSFTCSSRYTFSPRWCHREHHCLTDASSPSFYYQNGQRQSSYCNESTFSFKFQSSRSETGLF